MSPTSLPIPPATDKPEAESRPGCLRYGITGGIGSGKSYVCRILENAGYPVFYCDAAAKHIIRTDEAVRRDLVAEVGPELYDKTDGHLVKPVLSAYVCRGGSHAARVDAIVWPRVAAAFGAWCTGQASQAVFMECALLFESGFDRLTDFSVLVTAPEEVRIARIMGRDGVSRSKAKEWMSLQMPEEEKRARADFAICNDGETDLLPQISRILERLSFF